VASHHLSWYLATCFRLKIMLPADHNVKTTKTFWIYNKQLLSLELFVLCCYLMTCIHFVPETRLSGQRIGIPRIIINAVSGVCGTKWPIQVSRHSFHLLLERVLHSPIDNIFSTEIYAAATWCLYSPRIFKKIGSVEIIQMFLVSHALNKQ